MTSLAIKGTTAKQGIIVSKMSDVLWRLSLVFGPLVRAFLPPFNLADEGRVFSESFLVGGA